ncbi:MAG: hypothetical protein LBB53_05145 [Prevotellaceae bacterium]|nr:hypothetical protein [Prevotellaceae bacterium]
MIDSHIGMFKLPHEDIVFKPDLQSPEIKLQDNKVIVSKNYINKFCPAVCDTDNNNTSGLLFCKKYTFYENTIFRRTQLGHFEIIQRHSQTSIHNFIGNNSDTSFDVGQKDSFGVLLSSNNRDITITYYIDNETIDVIYCKLKSRYSRLSYDITILLGTYETSDKYAEKRHLFPYYKTENLPIKNTHFRYKKGF